MIRVDELMMGYYGISLIQMMENAGRALGSLARELLQQNLNEKKIAILTGKGGNGGGAMVAARRLHNWGATVSVICPFSDNELNDETRQQFRILEKLNLHFMSGLSGGYDLIIDGLIGYSIRGNPKPPVAELIHEINSADSPVISLDTPSGLDLTSGMAHSPVVIADNTLTLALPKYGLVMEKNRHITGNLYLADIGVPIELYGELGLDTEKLKHLFSKSDIIQLTR
jgi:NAD(P)H-hydrate epimerase